MEDSTVRFCGTSTIEGLMDEVGTIKVSAKSRSTAVAGAIAGVIREHKHADVQAIGAGAVNQAIKAIAIARGYLEQDGLDIVCVPTFVDVDVSGEERTAVKLAVEVRSQTAPLPGSRMAGMTQTPPDVEDSPSPEERPEPALLESAM
jgi:stage V sporulation protein S